MKAFLAITLLLFVSAAHAAQKSEVKLDYDAVYSYSLTVTDEDGENYFSVTLLKSGQLNYEYWEGAEQASSNDQQLTADQAKALTAKFSSAFDGLAKAKDESEGPTFALEKIDGRKSVTYTVVGATSGLKALLDATKSVANGNYPIEVQ